MIALTGLNDFPPEAGTFYNIVGRVQKISGNRKLEGG